jgi:hypothetical protein
MRVRDWQDILADVVEGDAEPGGWRAVGGTRSRGIGEDLYLGHPEAGLYHLKTYAKNPFEVRGVGTRLARRLDDEIGPALPDEAGGRFAVRQATDDEAVAETRARRVEETLRAHSEAPTTPDHLFADLMEALESPAFGPVDYDPRTRPEGVDTLAGTFEEAEALLEAAFEDVVEEDGVNRGFG